MVLILTVIDFNHMSNLAFEFRIDLFAFNFASF